jgi:hypothetical protein
MSRNKEYLKISCDSRNWLNSFFQELLDQPEDAVHSFLFCHLLADTYRICSFYENYNLALTQSLKNKDIPEGGAKGTILLLHSRTRTPYHSF